MTISELNNADRLEFEKFFMHNKKAQALDSEYQNLRSTGKWAQSIVARDRLHKLKEELFQKWVLKLSHEAEKIDLNKSDISNDTKERMNILYVTAFMACDIVESCVLDMNDALKKADASLSIEIFDSMRRLYSDAKRKLRTFSNTGYLDNIFWGDRCDEMYLIMQNKARKLIQYNKELKEEGKSNGK